MRNFTIIRHFWHAWRARCFRRRSRVATQLEMADRHYRMILLPITFETWKQKWRYFAILRRRVERDWGKKTLDRCLTWWKFSTEESRSDSRRIRYRLLMKRMYRTWLRRFRLRRDHKNSLTMSTVLDHWVQKTSGYRDLHRVAQHWDRRHVVRRFWREWFFRTCLVKTVQYYDIKLKQRCLARWVLRMRHLHELIRRGKIIHRRKLVSSALQNWKFSLSIILNQNAEATSQWRHRVLTESLHSWRRNLQLSLRAILLKEKIGNELLRVAFHRWKTTTYTNSLLPLTL